MAIDYSDALPVAGGLAGGIAGIAASQPDRDMQRKILQDLMAKYGSLQSPTFGKVDAATVGPSAYGNIGEDPSAAQGYAASDAALADIAKGGGLDLGDQAALAKTQGDIDRNEAAQRNELSSQFARRGQLGSGAQLAMSMQGQQQAAQQMSDQGMQIAGDARRRALQAIIQRNQLAQGRSDQLYGRQADKARANDIIARQNADARRQAGVYGNNQMQQGFENRLGITNGQARVGETGMKYYGDNANRVQQQDANIGDALGKVAGAGASAWKAGSSGSSGTPASDGSVPVSDPSEWEQW